LLLTNGNLTIRNATLLDAELLCKWWNNGAVMAHAGFPNGLGTTTERISAQLEHDSDDGGRRLIIEIGGVSVGEMSYRRKDSSKTAEIGIKICDFSKQGRGYGSQLLKMLITELFRADFDRIVLDTNIRNVRAQHVYEKIGFCRLGVRENSWTDQLGELQSAVDYELLAAEWSIERNSTRN
jgi:RimJ/RimL family protein N-acetyltransferase